MPGFLRPELDTDEFGGPGDLLDLIEPPAWHADAACKKAPLTVTWFPAKGGTGKAANRVCAGCPVRAQCRAWSLAQGPDLHGIWAGMDRRERNAVRAGKRAA